MRETAVCVRPRGMIVPCSWVIGTNSRDQGLKGESGLGGNTKSNFMYIRLAEKETFYRQLDYLWPFPEWQVGSTTHTCF